MPSSKTKKKRKPTPIPSHDLESTMSLAQVLDALGLDQAAALLDTATKKAITRNDSPTKLLDRLMREQLRVHVERRAQAALKRSRIFPLTALDTFDFDYPRSIDRELVMRAASLDFIEDKTNCVFVGPSGVGKTHLANAIGQLACLRGYRVRFVLAADLVNDLVAGQQRNTLQRRLSTWTAPDLVIIDEIGYTPIERREANLFFNLVSELYERASIVITSNKGFEQWAEMMGDEIMTTAMLDRLLHHVRIFSMDGDSYRVQHNQKIIEEEKRQPATA